MKSVFPRIVFPLDVGAQVTEQSERARVHWSASRCARNGYPVARRELHGSRPAAGREKIIGDLHRNGSLRRRRSRLPRRQLALRGRVVRRPLQHRLREGDRAGLVTCVKKLARQLRHALGTLHVSV